MRKNKHKYFMIGFSLFEQKINENILIFKLVKLKGVLFVQKTKTNFVVKPFITEHLFTFGYKTV